MANVKTITATTTESAVEFNATYQFMWFRNLGDNDCYISAHSGIVANADDVTLLKAGEVARLTLPQAPAQSKAYIKAADGSNTVEVHAQNYSDCPFKIGAKGGVRCLGTTTTELYDGSTANPIVIDGVSVTAKRNDIAFYDSGEFMFNGTTWSKFGDLSGLGDLAYKNTADTTYTPAGTVSTPTITVSKETTTVNSITAVGTLPSLVYNENTHMYSLSQGALPTKGADTTVMTNATATSTQPTFTGNEATIEVD